MKFLHIIEKLQHLVDPSMLESTISPQPKVGNVSITEAISV